MVDRHEIVEQRALEMRRDILRMVTAAGSGHPGGSLSAVDIVATLYFGDVLQYRVSDPRWAKRDYFILSKGHAAPVLYAALAQVGYFAREELLSLRKFGSRLQGHPDSLKLPGVEVSTGSLGQGLSIAAGLALGLAMNVEPRTEASVAPASTKAPYVYVLLGDGELQEGQVWEAVMFAAHRQIGNLIAIVDNNKLQIDGTVQEVNDLCSIEEKFKAFNWRVITCADGHNVEAIKQAFTQAHTVPLGKPSAPTVIVANTIKGKGVSFMENQCGWHGKAPSTDQCALALKELGV